MTPTPVLYDQIYTSALHAALAEYDTGDLIATTEHDLQSVLIRHRWSIMVELREANPRRGRRAIASLPTPDLFPRATTSQLVPCRSSTVVEQACSYWGSAQRDRMHTEGPTPTFSRFVIQLLFHSSMRRRTSPRRHVLPPAPSAVDFLVRWGSYSNAHTCQ